MHPVCSFLEPNVHIWQAPHTQQQQLGSSVRPRKELEAEHDPSRHLGAYMHQAMRSRKESKVQPRFFKISMPSMVLVEMQLVKV